MFRVIVEENESFYDNLVLESIRNNNNYQEIRICQIEYTPETLLTRDTPHVSSVNIVNTSENMENMLLLSVDNSCSKLENDEKYDQVAIKYLKEKNIK